MRRTFMGACGLWFAIALACHSVQAGDRKTVASMQKIHPALVALPVTRTVVTRGENPGPSATRRSGVGYLVAPSHQRSGESGQRSESGRATEHKPLTLFHFNSGLGEVAVRPVVGHVNGAQLSIGF